MEGYVVSIQNKYLRITVLGSSVFFEKELNGDVLDHTYVADEVGKLLLENFGPKAKKLPLNFLSNPSDIYLSFLTLGKSDSEEILIEQAKSKLGTFGIALENTYFNFQKIAPFVYQFIAIPKEKLEFYLSISNALEFPLASVIPWVLLLPKRVPNLGKPVIFVLDSKGSRYLALSEFGGIYHLGLLDDMKGQDEMEELIQKLSVYQRNVPITEIYTLGVTQLDLSKKYTINEVAVSDVHELLATLSQTNVSQSYLNMLNMLPLPEPVKKSSPMVYVGGVLVALVLVGGLFGISKLNKPSDNNIASNNDTVVLSESSQSSQLSTSETTSEEDKSEVIPDAVDLNRSYLRIRIENGTSIGGLAGRTRDALSKLGYEITSIGDADESNREQTLIRFNEKNAIYKDLLSADLNELTGEVEVKTDLSSDLDYDVLIVMGSNEK